MSENSLYLVCIRFYRMSSESLENYKSHYDDGKVCSICSEQLKLIFFSPELNFLEFSQLSWTVNSIFDLTQVETDQSS